MSKSEIIFEQYCSNIAIALCSPICLAQGYYYILYIKSLGMYKHTYVYMHIHIHTTHRESYKHTVYIATYMYIHVVLIIVNQSSK